MQKKPRMYVLKKYVKALSALDAIRQDKTHQVDEATLDENWKDWAMADALDMPNPYEDNDMEE